MPILTKKRWRRGRLATVAAVGKNSVYEYLDGTRTKITDENRTAIADALGLKPEQLPDWPRQKSLAITEKCSTRNSRNSIRDDKKMRLRELAAFEFTDESDSCLVRFSWVFLVFLGKCREYSPSSGESFKVEANGQAVAGGTGAARPPGIRYPGPADRQFVRPANAIADALGLKLEQFPNWPSQKSLAIHREKFRAELAELAELRARRQKDEAPLQQM
jgi:hypothetical protein